MLCEECQLQPPTVFVTQIVDGHTTKRQFCEACAEPLLRMVDQQTAQSVETGDNSFNYFPDDSFYEQLVSGDDRFTIDAFRFVHRAVQAAFTALSVTPDHHVTGRDVAEAFRLLALREFGAAALSTLDGWGLRSTADIGAVVFRMIECGFLGARAEDSPEDFQNVYDFPAAFPTAA
jgi:uncharacterized repeat protein (TIGR04138 family)